MNRATLKLPNKDQRIIGQKAERVFTFERASADEDSRTVTAALSSTAPVERWWGWETLIHTKAAVNLERASPALPLLFNHDTDQIVGSAESVRLEGDKLRARLRFANTDRGEEIWTLIRDGHLRGVSVGYQIDAIESAGERDGQPAYNVTRWTIYEASICPVPADTQAGIGRNHEVLNMSNETTSRAEQRNEQRTNNPEYRRINELLAAGDTFPQYGGREVARELIESGGSVQAFNDRILERMRGAQKPIATAEPYIFPDSARIAPPSHRGTLHPILLRQFDGDRHKAEAELYGAGQWLRARLGGNKQAARWCMDHGLMQRDASEGVDSDGGYLVPAVLSNSVLDFTTEYGIARQECRTIPMSGASLAVPVRKTGVTAYFVGENQETTKSSATWGAVNLTPKKLAVLSVMSSEIDEDSVIDLASWIAMECGRSFAQKEDQCWIDGDGTSTYGGMQGLRTMLIDGTHNAGKVTAGSAIDTFAEITTGDLSNVVAKLPQPALRNAKWYCSQTAYALVFHRLIQAAGGITLNDLVNGPIKQGYLGFPIVITEAMPSGASTDYSGAVMLAFGDMTQATLLGSRREIRIKVDASRYLEFDQIAVLATERFHIVNHQLGDNSTAGAVVGLVGN